MTKIKKARVSKEMWLMAALDVLAASGHESVKVERLAKQLGVAKTGFYWHFKDRGDLLRQLLHYWEEEFTGVVVVDARLRKLPPRDRLLAVANMIRKRDLARYDLSVQAWARRDAAARKAVSRVMDRRLGYIRDVFRELGLSGDELEMRAMLFVAYHSWEAATYGHLPTRTLQRLAKHRIDLLCRVD